MTAATQPTGTGNGTPVSANVVEVEQDGPYIGVEPVDSPYADPGEWDVWPGSGVGGYMDWWGVLTTAEVEAVQQRGNVEVYLHDTGAVWEKP